MVRSNGVKSTRSPMMFHANCAYAGWRVHLRKPFIQEARYGFIVVTHPLPRWPYGGQTHIPLGCWMFGKLWVFAWWKMSSTLTPHQSDEAASVKRRQLRGIVATHLALALGAVKGN